MRNRGGVLTFEVAERSHAGHVRALNEDAAVVAPPVFAVADGMGGHKDGEIASGIAAEVMTGFGREGPHDTEGLDRALTLANARIREETKSVEDAVAGTTLVGLVLAPDGPFAFNVGDSRLYSLSDGRLSQLSRDHSAVQELIDAGLISAAAGAEHEQRNVITRAVGVDPTVEADIWAVDVAIGDRFILASDGLTGEVDDSRIEEIVAMSSDVDAAAEALLTSALDAGGRDNISIVVIEVLDREVNDDVTDDDTEPRPREHSGDTTERRRRAASRDSAARVIGIEDVLGAGETDG